MHSPRREKAAFWPRALIVSIFLANAGLAFAAPVDRMPPVMPPGILHKVQATPAGFSVSDVSGLPGRPIPLKIHVEGVSEKSPGQLFIFTGIPDGVMLNLGGFLGDFWAVNSKIVDQLTLTAPENFAGTFTIRIKQSGGKAGSAPRVASFTVTVGEFRAQQTSATTADPLPSAAAKRSPNEQMLLSRARDKFQNGDVSGARLIFEYLASQGSPVAAMATGETYDPEVLSQMAVMGLEADAGRAQLWYQKAEQLGSAEARSRLKSLATR
ncbi:MULTISPECIES: hypothetical protein [Rhodomicrobium]|uniref:hypothetical protein n=1 Tax=Rhodomicrobium TaxID=1068 RepID=UPI000B4AD9C9|nr:MULTISPECIES: hypothetical protein [Rhodomicrobium]